MEIPSANGEDLLRERRVGSERNEQEQSVQTEEANVQGRRVRVSNKGIAIALTVSVAGVSLLGALSAHWVHSRMGCTREDNGYGCSATRDTFNYLLIAAGASGVLGVVACKVKVLAEGLGRVGEKLLFVED
ncbi:MAG: hypothetical protein ACI9S8_002744 [Chlamydiales bacterium]|jgi:hypothetical protein